MKLIERENEILMTIKGMIEADLDFIIVGGYAVSALARHRYSVDCDIVITKDRYEIFEKLLKKKGFVKHIEKSGFDKIYAGEFVSYRKIINGFPITIDLLINSLVCRNTGAAWSFNYIKKYSIEENIPGLETFVRCKAPEKELLIAFKIHSARKTDVRDIVMLRENLDIQRVLLHLRRGNIETLKLQMDKIIYTLDDKKLVDSLKGVFILPIDVKGHIETTKKLIENLLNSLFTQ
ncbi:MAG: hypothetical protein ACTSPY_14075 [Candidatus Helarchaeota archaeon]